MVWVLLGAERCSGREAGSAGQLRWHGLGLALEALFLPRAHHGL